MINLKLNEILSEEDKLKLSIFLKLEGFEDVKQSNKLINFNDLKNLTVLKNIYRKES